MHGHGKSDRPVVPAKPPNNAGVPAAEVVEGRGLGKGNAASKTHPGHRAGVSAPSALDRVRRVAGQDKDVRFTALLHHVDVDRLRAAYGALNPKAATGVDGVTWYEYGAGPRREPSGSPCSCSQGRLPGETVSEGVHPEGGRAAATVGRCRAGGQDPSAC